MEGPTPRAHRRGADYAPDEARIALVLPVGDESRGRGLREVRRRGGLDLRTLGRVERRDANSPSNRSLLLHPLQSTEHYQNYLRVLEDSTDTPNLCGLADTPKN